MVPSGSMLLDPSNVTVCPTVGLAGVKVKEAVGALSEIAFVAVDMPTEPLLSVTVNVTV